MTSTIMFVIVIISFALMIVLSIISIYLYREAKQNSPLLESRNQLLESIEKLKKDIEVGNGTLDRLREEIESKSSEAIEGNRIIEKAEALKKWMEENGSSEASLRHKIEIAKADYETISKKLADKEAERDKLLEQLKEIKEACDASDLKRNQNERISKDLVDDISSKKMKIRELENQLDVILKKTTEASKTLNDLESKIREKQAELDRVENKIKDKDELLSTVKNLENTYNDLQTKISKSREDIAISKGVEESNNDIWTDLDRPLIEPNININANKEPERKSLDKFTSLLNDNNIKFNDRTIKAFHTGLKSEDSSPLVVLSGISGTGKSLLPKLYSNFMGMNFTAMAVQPRWDSPQDMLGFYNYMQKRYKATELARLLWQFDIYNNKDCAYKGDNNSKLPMNLVLLDEMNLARVEYYFSDMLSKLELRRTVNPESSLQRKAAEIEIECGALDNNKKARKLFVNNNTLFVGTMNEDETTQVLSDKVIDRANVIRFGKPEKLQAKANTIAFSEACENRFLSLEDWNNHWCETKSIFANKDEKLNSTIEAINTELEKVGRPFGHRVWNSIENYIRLYPGIDDNPRAYNEALSDQIEMKILPKLNGLEKDSTEAEGAINKIGNIIDSLNDEELKNAYDKAKEDTSNVFFQWRGVVR